MKTQVETKNIHDSRSSFFLGSHTLENGDITDFNKEVARQVFQYLTLGTKFDIQDPKINKCFILLAKALILQSNPELNQAFRLELQNMLCALAAQFKKTPKDEQKYEILISHLLATYPFFADHKCAEVLIIPQKINEQWQSISYKVQALDLSPQTGVLSTFIHDEDRIYAYGLTPENLEHQAHRLLLLMGTTYPTGQGSALSILRLFDPGYSVGEGYNWNLVEKWLKESHIKVKVAGLSQGGASAMFVAANYRQHIIQSDCYNPPALCTATLNRLGSKWLHTPKDSRPKINVYVQRGDPVFPLEHGFFEGTKIFCIIAVEESYSNINLISGFVLKMWEAHIHFFVGRQDSRIELEHKKEDFTPWRVFFGDMKATVNLIIFPFLYINFIVTRVLHHAQKWCWQHLATGLLIPAVAIIGIPYYALKLSLALTFLVAQITLLVPALLLTALASGFKIGISSALGLLFNPPLDEQLSPLVSYRDASRAY